MKINLSFLENLNCVMFTMLDVYALSEIVLDSVLCYILVPRLAEKL